MGHLQQHLNGLVARSSAFIRFSAPSLHGKKIHGKKIGSLLIGLSVGALLSACASHEMEPPVAQMARAETSIENAEQVGARDAAPLELQSAHRHLAQAQQASANDENRQALWLAEKAEADADLAEAKARTEQVYLTVAELQEGVRVLEDELERNSELDAN